MKKSHNNVNGENNPMYGKSVFDIWVYKYGFDKAIELNNSKKEKMSKSTSGTKKPILSEKFKGEQNPSFYFPE